MSRKEKAVNYIEGIVTKLGYDVTFDVTDEKNGVIITFYDKIFLENNAELLNALQYLVSTVVNRRQPDFFKISLDCEGFRSKRQEELEIFAKKVGNNVLKSGISATLQPMNAYERRIVHAVINSIDGINSKSTGVDPARKIVIFSDNPQESKPITVRKRVPSEGVGYDRNSNKSHENRTRGADKGDKGDKGGYGDRGDRGNGGYRRNEPYIPKPVRPLNIYTSFDKLGDDDE